MKYSPKYFTEFEKRHLSREKFRPVRVGMRQSRADRTKKTQHLIKLGVATALGHEGNVQKLAKRALEDGVSPDELRQAVFLSTTTAGFPTMLAAMQWVEEVIATKGK